MSYKETRFNYMKEGRDFCLINKINNHYFDLKEDFSTFKTLGDYKNGGNKRRAALFDFLQMGELINQLSKSFLSEFNNINAERMISMRNKIVHGYDVISDEKIFNTIKNDLQFFIDELNSFSRKRYSDTLNTMLGKTIEVVIDRPIGFMHQDIKYLCNYGYIRELTALDGELQDVYVLCVDKPLNTFIGQIIAIVRRIDDVEDKLIVVPKGIKLTEEEIEKYINFQEIFFKHTIMIK